MGIKYQIRIDYKTGNSFESYETSDFLDGEPFENLEIAKENLKRIKAVNDYHEQPYYSANKILRPEYYTEEGYLKLKADSGNEYQIYPFWIGYFECLLGAEIVLDQTDMSFRV